MAKSLKVGELTRKTKEDNINDNTAQQVLDIWINAGVEGAQLVLRPSQTNGVAMISHTMGGPLLKINGLISRSPLANNAFYTFEHSKFSDRDTKYLNLYVINIPDVPGTNGEESTVRFYIRRLEELGLVVNATQSTWYGSSVFANDKSVVSIPHSSSNLTPQDFSQRTLKALGDVMDLLEQRALLYAMDVEN